MYCASRVQTHCILYVFLLDISGRGYPLLLPIKCCNGGEYIFVNSFLHSSTYKSGHNPFRVPSKLCRTSAWTDIFNCTSQIRHKDFRLDFVLLRHAQTTHPGFLNGGWTGEHWSKTNLLKWQN